MGRKTRTFRIDNLPNDSLKQWTINAGGRSVEECASAIVSAAADHGASVSSDLKVIQGQGIFKKALEFPGALIEGAGEYWGCYVITEKDGVTNVWRMESASSREKDAAKVRNQIDNLEADLAHDLQEQQGALTKLTSKGIYGSTIKLKEIELNGILDPQDMANEEAFYSAVENAIVNFGAPSAAPAPAQPAAAPSAGGFCGNCGAPIKPGSKFCTSCGAKL